MIGTVVIFLPTYFEEGKLIIKYNDKEVSYGYDDLGDDYDKAKAIFFYPDCIHEVLPVKGGYRLTITCDIVSLENDSKTYDINKVCIDEIQKIINEQKNNVGIILNYKYTQNICPKNLKGNDLKLFNLLNENLKNVKIKLQTIIVENTITIDVTEDSDRKEHVKNYIYSSSDLDFENFIKSEKIKSRKNYDFYSIKIDGLVVDNFFDGGASYTGNESRDQVNTTYYLNGAILIDKT